MIILPWLSLFRIFLLFFKITVENKIVPSSRFNFVRKSINLYFCKTDTVLNLLIKFKILRLAFSKINFFTFCYNFSPSSCLAYAFTRVFFQEYLNVVSSNSKKNMFETIFQTGNKFI